MVGETEKTLFVSHTPSSPPVKDPATVIVPQSDGYYPSKYIQILSLLKELKVVTCVEWDWKTLDQRTKEDYTRWVRHTGHWEVKASWHKRLVAALDRIGGKWQVAKQNGMKFPILQSLDVDGKWTVTMSQGKSRQTIYG